MVERVSQNTAKLNMQTKTKHFKKAAEAVLRDEKAQAHLRGIFGHFNEARQSAAAATPDWEGMRERGRVIKAHTINNLDHYLEMLEANVVKAGGKIYFAKDADAANRYVLDLASERDVQMAIKGKSMVSEEMGLNDRLAEAGVEAVETDLGEYIIQLAEQTPFHIIAPAVHMSKEDVSDLFQRKLGTPKYEKISDLTSEARSRLRDKFIRADMGITGGNFLVAETGTLVLVTNEGNGRMCTSMPRIHVAIVGMEKIVPTMDDLGLLLRLLIRSATGQRLSTYVTTVTGPRADDETDGPDEFHLVIVDNGRSRLLADTELRESLSCLRCGACLNVCPVYRKVGGHSYGWVYPGPIGAVVSPILTNLSEAKDLPYASSLCGSCRDVCPVKINIPRMLLHLRHELVEGKTYPAEKSTSLWERIAFRGWRMSFDGGFSMRTANRLGNLLQRPFVRRGRLRWLPPPLSGWTRYRTLRPLASKSFRKRWRRGIRD